MIQAQLMYRLQCDCGRGSPWQTSRTSAIGEGRAAGWQLDRCGFSVRCPDCLHAEDEARRRQAALQGGQL